MSKFHPRIQAFGDDALLLSWASDIRPETIRSIRILDTVIRKELYEMVKETVITYTHLAVFFVSGISYTSRVRYIEDLLERNPVMGEEHPQRIIEIPVCYQKPYALDIDTFSQTKGWNNEKTIEIHTSVEYEVCFIGFMPGFPYLTNLDPRLFIPRKHTPRRIVPAGSVGIGGQQAGIYPLNSPGGWHIIGRTPFRIFDSTTPPYAAFRPGDRIRFKAISSTEFEELQGKSKDQLFQLLKNTER